MSKIVKDVGIETMELDSLKDDKPFMFLSDEEEQVHAKPNAKTKDTSSRNIKLEKQKAGDEAKVALLSTKPSFLNVQQLTELLVNSLKPELSKPLTGHDFSSFIPTKLKEIPSKIIDINGAVAALENLKLDLPAGLLALIGQVSSINVQLSKLKLLDALLSLLNKVTKALDRFAHAIESTSQKAGDTSGETFLITEEEIKNQKKIEQALKVDVVKAKIKKGTEELIDLLGLDVVEIMYKEKMKYDKYCPKMLNKRASRKITNYDVLSKGKDPITLKVYRDDGSGQDDLARTFSSLLVAEVDKRNLNPNKQIRLIEQLGQYDTNSDDTTKKLKTTIINVPPYQTGSKGLLSWYYSSNDKANTSNSDSTTYVDTSSDEEIPQFQLPSKYVRASHLSTTSSKHVQPKIGSSSKLKKVPPQKVLSQGFPSKSLIPIKNYILSLAAIQT
ncbi:hypothetical protein Tco_1312568 [Tanacetum coccineum]